MAPNLQALRDRTVAAVDRVHGELVRIVPKGKEDQFTGSSDDAERLAIEIVAKLHRENATGRDLGFRGDRNRALIASGTSHLYIDRAKLPADYAVRKGDVIVALERNGNPEFRIVLVDDRSLARLVLNLEPAGSASA
jgi:hypothetical protein